MKLILLILGISSFLFAQSRPAWFQGKDSFVHGHRIMQRDTVSGKFVPAHGMPPVSVPFDTVGRTWLAWDGEFLYQWEILKDWGVKVRYAFTQETTSGPQWFWTVGVQLPSPFRVLAVGSQIALAEERGFKDEKDGLVYRLHAINVVNGETRLVTAMKDPARVLSAEAAVKDHEFIIVMNSGQLFHLPLGTVNLKTILENFWPGLSERYIQEIVREGNREVHSSPPHFVGSAFFGPSGELFFPMTVRETNTWSEAAIQRAFEAAERRFNELPKEEQHKLIASGAWPPKNRGMKSFQGSDDVFVLLSYTSEEKKLIKVPESRLGKLVKQDEFTGQWKLSGHGGSDPKQALGWSVIAQTREGDFVPVGELIQESPTRIPGVPVDKGGEGSLGKTGARELLTPAQVPAVKPTGPAAGKTPGKTKADPVQVSNR